MDLSASFTRALLSGFDRAYADLVRAATRSTGSREEAGDLVHDTWLRLAEHARSAPAEAADLAGAANPAQMPRDATAYLAVMAQHMALDAHRRHQRHARYLGEAAVHEQLAPSHAPDVADSVMYRQALAVLESALHSLPERCRAAFIAHRVQGERQPEIAERLGVSLNTVERDLIQASACIEDALHRWRGTRPGGAVARHAGRRRSLAALLGVAGFGLGGSLGWQQWRHYRDTHVQWQAGWSSLRGQQVRHGLPDGSSLLLDALSSAQVEYFATRRVVQLTQGAAFFEVERDEDRPFTVQAGGVRVTVLGTRFGVELATGAQGQERVTVQVESGRVRVQSDADGGRFYELSAGQGLRMEGTVATQTRGDAGQAASWRHGELVFADATLGEALARLSRYAPFDLQATPEAARLPLSGRVRIAKAHAWVRALPHALPVQVRRQADGGLLVAAAG
ncbi:anti-FecI sigma factor, FecR [Delftia sp. Cs1-4]|uniref:sigma-70 family RNA polymerase sigma factor n=1 Tax=Delftia sp. (strain Cs1-4) TaxID=742013 RepID=UPI00020E7EC1|nr:sigma-70 family RNA polymerase sigma factor [Delftia sp. Cs1-4]AEF90484.1 anti-FecI sigma factor, FecR [Delftia sp. Cs1-4]